MSAGELGVERSSDDVLRSPRTTLATLGTYLVALSLALIIGAVGPVAIKKHNSTHSTRSHDVVAARTEYPVFSGALTAMVPAHQMLWLDCLVARPASFGSKGDKTFQLAFEVSATGETKQGKTHKLATKRYDYHTVRCKGGEAWCKAVPLFAQHAILYDRYDVAASVVHAFGTYPGAGISWSVDGTTMTTEVDAPVLTTKMELHFVNREYTSFELGFYAVYLVASVLAVVAPRVGFYARLPASHWTPEQGWCLALLVAHAVGFVNPLYALEVGAKSKVASLVLSALYLYGCFTFLGLGLCYALLFAHALNEPVRARRRVTLKLGVGAVLLCATWGVLGATRALFGRLEGAGEPQYDDPGHHHVYAATDGALACCTACYCAAYAYLYARCAKKLHLAPAHDLLSIWLLHAFVVSAFVGAFVGGYDTVHTKPLAFAAFLSAPTFAVWCLAFLNAKSGFRKDDDGVDGGMENDMNAML
ncbi:hypothetical protein JL722_9955 [Aureococcus anophagefferens]|nr:hypothetical protein JL722_9955 [Aureococcus anophagefferens]